MRRTLIVEDEARRLPLTEFLSFKEDVGRSIIYGHGPTSDCRPDVRQNRLTLTPAPYSVAHGLQPPSPRPAKNRRPFYSRLCDGPSESSGAAVGSTEASRTKTNAVSYRRCGGRHFRGHKICCFGRVNLNYSALQRFPIKPSLWLPSTAMP
jgi:hypothetical protein